MMLGNLVRMPSSPYWWGDQIGIIDFVEPEGSSNVMYRVTVPGKGTVRFGQINFVEIISESR